MSAKKLIGVLSASAKDARQFVCPAATNRAEDVTLLFQDDLAAKKLELVRLSLDDLPKMHQNEPIDWIINFGIREQGTDNYVNVPYTLMITPRPGRKLVYFDGKEVKLAPVAKSAPAEFAGKVAVNLGVGDPGVGWDGPTAG
jgi:hypothetical protein